MEMETINYIYIIWSALQNVYVGFLSILVLTPRNSICMLNFQNSE